MRETSKAMGRRLAEGWFRKYLKGKILDICCGDDPVTPNCDKWDMPEGDAQKLKGVAAETYDCVYSSHGLEHMVDPLKAIERWWEVVKPGGHLIVIVPDEDLYEQGIWPSRWNPDHKTTWTAHKSSSWSAESINAAALIAGLKDHKLISIQTCDYGYDYSGGVWDRTLAGGEAAIEIIIQKVPETNYLAGFQDVWDQAYPLACISQDRGEHIWKVLRSPRLPEGEVWECGVWRGGSAMVISGAAPDRAIRLFDTFGGMPHSDRTIDEHVKGDFGDSDINRVRHLFRKSPNVSIYQGTAPGTFKGLENTEIAFLHLDVDVYQSVKEILKWCYPRMASGGVILVDDYNCETCKGCNKAVDEFFAKQESKPEPFPLGGCLIRT